MAQISKTATGDNPPGSVSELELLNTLNRLRDSFDKRSVSPLYTMGLFLVTCAMLGLTIVYASLVGGAGYLLYYHAANHAHLLESGRISVGAFVYGAPLLVGSVFLLFMLKPIFRSAPPEAKTRTLRRDEAPLLFAFIKKLCRVLGAPTPDRINVDCQINASAGHHMMASEGDKLVLTIGLPLVGGLSLRQLAGVLAHEFGHFSQGAGMQFTMLTWRINHWFARLVYERDHLDATLETAAEHRGPVYLVAQATRLCVWASRRLLWVCMHLGHAVSCFQMRQMEYDADRYEIGLAGSETFEQTAFQLQALGLACNMVFGEINETWEEGILGDDLTALVVAKSKELPPEAIDWIKEHVESRSTALFDTHPSDAARVAEARRFDAPGIFDIDAPATILFQDFTSLSKALTEELYRGVLGEEFEKARLISTTEVEARREKRQASDRCVGRYFQGCLPDSRLLFIGTDMLEPPQDPRLAMRIVKAARQKVEARRDEIRETYDDYANSEAQETVALAALVLQQAGLRIDPAEFGLTATGLELAHSGLRSARAQREEAASKLRPFESLQRKRLLTSLEVLCHRRIRAKLGDKAPDLLELENLLDALHALEGLSGRWMTLRQRTVHLEILAQNLEGNEENEALIKSISPLLPEITDLLRSVRTDLMHLSFPFEHRDAELSIGEWLVPEIPDEMDLGGVYAMSTRCLGCLHELHTRLLGELGALGERLERALGMKPLPEPTARQNRS